MDYLCIPHTIVYLFDVLQTSSDFVSTLFIFGDIEIPMFRLFIVLADCTITIGSDFDPYGLLVVSDPSDAIITSPRLFLLIFAYHSHFTNNNIVLRSPHLCETSYHFDSTSTSFPFVPRPYISHIDLATLRPTSLRFVRPRSFDISLF